MCNEKDKVFYDCRNTEHEPMTNVKLLEILKKSVDEVGEVEVCMLVDATEERGGSGYVETVAENIFFDGIENKLYLGDY